MVQREERFSWEEFKIFHAYSMHNIGTYLTTHHSSTLFIYFFILIGPLGPLLKHFIYWVNCNLPAPKRWGQIQSPY